MSNCKFLMEQPISDSNLMCLTCNHLYDPIYRVCTCEEDKRKVVPFSKYMLDKYEVKLKDRRR